LTFLLCGNIIGYVKQKLFGKCIVKGEINYEKFIAYWRFDWHRICYMRIS